MDRSGKVHSCDLVRNDSAVLLILPFVTVGNLEGMYVEMVHFNCIYTHMRNGQQVAVATNDDELNIIIIKPL